MEATQKYFTARETASIIGVSYRLILKWIGDGELECHRIGDNEMIRVSYEQITRFMAKHKINETPLDNEEENYGELEELETSA